MQDSMYSALFGALTTEHRMNMIANNLANASTTGYKREKLNFKDTFLRFAHDYVVDARPNLRDKQLLPEPDMIAKPRIGQAKIDFSDGGMRQTGNPLDLAIQGEGFFKIDTPDGVMYTRNGSFRVSEEGQLVNGQGHPVLGKDGPVEIPPGATVQVNNNGRLIAAGNDLGALDIVTFEEPAAVLEKEGRNQFRPKNRTTPPEETPAENAVVSQGFLEMANVEVVEEMVNMIETSRAFEAYQKVMSTNQTLDERNVRDVGTTR